MSELAAGELRWFGHRLSPDFKQVRFIVISDTHYGNPLFAESHFRRTLEFIKASPDVYCMLNGDICESTIKTSRGEIYKQVGSPQDQRDWAIEQFMPFKDKILGVTIGNHEQRIWNDCGVDISRDIASALGVPYRAEGIMLKIMFGRGNERHPDQPYVFWAYITHGYGGARTKAAKAVKAERVAAWMPSCDLIAMSHDHVVNIAPDVAFHPDNRGIMDKETGFLTGAISAHRRSIVKTNAYLKWGGYAEMGGYPPSDLATPVIHLLSPQAEMWRDLPDKPRHAVKVIV